jgi:DNA-binding transcriptional LysR family regulator
MQLLMDSRKLLYLATVVEQGSLNKAAKRLDVSQPALSKAMDRLEDGLGVKLLDLGAKRNHRYRVWRAFVLARKIN